MKLQIKWFNKWHILNGLSNNLMLSAHELHTIYHHKWFYLLP